MKKLTLKSLILFVVLMCVVCVLYGEVTTLSYTPVTRIYYPSHVGGGDNDFMGHGPHVIAKVALYIKGNGVWANISISAQETVSDWTEFKGTWDDCLWAAPPGYTIRRIISPQSLTATVEYDDNNHNLDYFNGTPPQGGPLTRFVIMGDQFGNDQPYMYGYFNQLSVEIERGN